MRRSCADNQEITPSAHTDNHTVQSCVNLLKAGWSRTFSAKSTKSLNGFVPGHDGGFKCCQLLQHKYFHCCSLSSSSAGGSQFEYVPLLPAGGISVRASFSNHCATQHVFSQTRDQPLSHRGKRASCLFFIRTFEWLRNNKKVLMCKWVSFNVCLFMGSVRFKCPNWTAFSRYEV